MAALHIAEVLRSDKNLLNGCANSFLIMKLARLEIIDVDVFVDENLEKIKKILAKVKDKKSLNFVFLTCIDLEKAFNKIVVIDDQTQKILESALDVKFKNGVTKRNGILMRKEMVPKIKELIDSGRFP